ncbi:hypothetical protein U3A58_12210 [Algoriphagus sp. C2-6-M1]|uniref:hypothetical protein n=1 Tax=Algoriphagus persicinus TaxID=3108754 RepID=UPI002B3695E8|nr:hypothetical protein [Algoriphagus sp. C2-6-M1]MEB2781158.1 hypothetical protein [Algoriphagus sp. C2-6-M1]
MSYEEIQRLLLKDEEGNITDFNVLTLEKALIWSKGKVPLHEEINCIQVLSKKELIFWRQIGR